jgi:hypothetical protein
MKANKALKRLSKIESLMADVAERFSASAPHLQEALKDLKAAMLSVKEAVKVQTSPPAATERSPKKASSKKAARSREKAAVKKTATPKVKAKKRARVKKAASSKPLASTAVHSAAVTGREAMPASAHAE